ncbi:MAG: hypothetical protein RJA19_720 [Bacteroidota bacterium]
MKPQFPLLLLSITWVTGCVLPKKHAEIQTQLEQAQSRNLQWEQAAQEAEIAQREMKGRIEVLESDRSALSADTAAKGKSLMEAQAQIQNLQQLNEVLNEQSSARMAAINAENRALLTDMARIRTELQRQEDSLKVLDEGLRSRSAELAERSQRVQELETALAAREEAANALRNRVAQALLGFADKGLTVEQRDGKVYVSLEAKLLFPSGSTVVNPEGKKALLDLASVIAASQDLEVIVEGHTDTDALRSAAIPRNNWELSVLRATAVVEILTRDGKVAPEVLTAAGRSEYHPVDETDKARNRRIEIVLAPDLDALFEIIRN